LPKNNAGRFLRDINFNSSTQDLTSRSFPDIACDIVGKLI
jgi:hypothetical protein